MEESDVDDAVVGFVDGGEVFGGFFDEGQEDEAKELVGGARMDDGFDFAD